MFAAHSVNNPIVTINGQRIPHEDRMNRIAIGGFVIIGVLLIVFTYFYISPLFRERPANLKSKESRARTAVSSDTEAGADMDPVEKSTLLAWMHRRSRGRFVDVDFTGSAHQNLQIPCPPKLEPRSHGKRVNSFFSRISAVPNLVFPSLPPPIFAIQPPVPASNASDTSSKMPTKRPFFPATRLSFRSKSVLSVPDEVTTNTASNRVSMVGLGDNTTKNLSCTPDTSLHPAWSPRIPSPSKAAVVDKARNCGFLSRNDTHTMISEVKTESVTVQQQFSNSRAKVVGESDPF